MDVHELLGSIDDVYAWAYERGWTDGLPIIPPTADRVEKMMASVPRAPQEVVAELPPRRAAATIEALAVNAVMAGCLPQYFPVVVTAIEALTDPKYALLMMNTSTNPSAPMLIINGPIRAKLDINCSWSVLGPGNRANATIGRAVSLAMINLAGRVPGTVSKSTHSQPGRYSFCLGEYEEKNPWEPLHVERGFKAEDSTVTVAAPTGTINVHDKDSKRAEHMLMTLAHSMEVIGSNNVFIRYGYGEIVIILCPDHAALIAQDFSKQQAKERLLELTSKMPASWFPPPRLESMRAGVPDQIQGDYVRLAARPDQFLIVVAGGHGGYHSVACHTLGMAFAVTRRIPS